MSDHALYRFYSDDNTLLYIGITLNPGARWKSHSKDKPWWSEVAQITVETYPTREAVADAERAAIIAEHPRHNVVHNRGTKATPRLVPVQERSQPLQVGDWVALGLQDGRCPVGEIAAMDDIWVSLRLKNFLDGGIDRKAIACRWTEVERVEIAYPEDAFTDINDTDDWRDRASLHLAPRVMNDRHLGEFQTAWTRAKLPTGGDPVDEARRAVRQEDAARAERRGGDR